MLNCLQIELLRNIHLSAANLITKLTAICCHRVTEGTSPNCEHSLRNLSESYFQISSMLDTLPPWLHNLETSKEQTESAVQDYQRTGFWVQRSGFLTSFYCLRLLILQQCVISRKLEVVGLPFDRFSIATKKLELIFYFIKVIISCPFESISVQGEPLVSMCFYFTCGYLTNLGQG